MSVNITQGTQTAVKTTTIAGAEFQHVILNQGATADSPFSGTLAALTSLANMVKGTVTKVEGGTIGEITSVVAVPAIGNRHVDRFATVIQVGTSALGTIKPAVSGSAIYVTDIVISAGSATNVQIASGGTSTPLLGTLFFNANGGAVMNFRTELSTASGSALVYKQSVDGPLTISVAGYVD